MNFNVKKLAFLCISLSLYTQGFTQSDSLNGKLSSTIIQTKEDKPLKYNLNDDGSHFFQITFLNQTWLRYNESNPGSTVLGKNANHTFDIGLRRTRMQLFGQLSDRVFLYFQFGMNNFNFLNGYNSENPSNSTNRKLQAFFHDAVGEYRVSKSNQLKLGAGLTIANGLSRFSNPSVGTILALDLPIFAQATVDQTDEFSRKLSIYARGQIGKFDYRAIISDPFPIQTNGNSTPAINVNATFAGIGHHKQYQGYLIYQFFEHENHLTPYMAGSFLGTKKVFNVASGIIYQNNAVWKNSDSGKDTVYQDMILTSLESFLDVPLNKEKGTAITAYAGYFNYNFGSNYIRTQAQMNPATGITINDPNFKSTVSGSGNGWPMMGTGSIIYTQVGYLFKKNILGAFGTLQPYVTYQLNKFDRLKDNVQVYNLGINILNKGHKSKFSLDYQNRPIFKSNNTVGGRRGCLILQYQISI